MKLAIFGAGSWGTAMAIYLSHIGHSVCVYGRNKQYIQEIQETRESKKYLPGIKIPESIEFVSDVREAAAGAEYVVLSVSAQNTRKFLEEHAAELPRVPVISLAKGLEVKTHKRMSEVIEEFLSEPVVVLSGPSHAEEVAINIPTVLVAASKDTKVANDIQLLFSSKHLRIYTSSDYVGVELAGAIKNITAIAVGISDGIGFGDNTRAGLMTRSMAEIMRLGIAMGARMETFLGLSGFGDLIVTCTSKHSRNRRFGELIGRGYSIQEAKEEVGMVVEGLSTLSSVYELSHDFNISMPIVDTMVDVLYNKHDLQEAIESLMTRDYKEETC